MSSQRQLKSRLRTFVVDLLSLGEGQHARDAGEHLFEARNFPLQMSNACVGQPVYPGRAPLRGGADLRFEKTLSQHPLQSRIQ